MQASLHLFFHFCKANFPRSYNKIQGQALRVARKNFEERKFFSANLEFCPLLRGLVA
jgi:hypothetical protein